MADLLESKLELARSFGATPCINAREQDVVTAVRDLTGGEGVDYAFEVIGNPKTMATAYQAVRRGGTAVAVGVPPFGSEMTIKPATSSTRRRRSRAAITAPPARRATCRGYSTSTLPAACHSTGW